MIAFFLQWIFMRIYFISLNRSEIAFRNILVIGTGEECEKMINIFKPYQFWGLRICGIIKTADGSNKDSILGIKILGNLKDFSNILNQSQNIL